MRFKLNLLIILIATPISCQKEEAIVQQQEVKFSLAIPAAANRGGRANAAEVKSVVVTITDSEGNSISEREKIALYAFGDNYLSAPITLKTTGASQYQLTEFMVTDANDQVLFATPIEGSNLAHLVTDPLAIGFTVSKDQITTVTPEVLAVNEDSTPEEFGYGQFGFSIKETVSSIISAFVKGSDNFELTTAHLKVEGLKSEATDNNTPDWVYEMDLEAKANRLHFRKAAVYKLTITKSGYNPCIRIVSVNKMAKIDAFLDFSNLSYDIYLAGGAYIGSGNESARAMYWKNGETVVLSNVRSYASDIFVQDSDVYIAGYEEPNSQYTQVFYWKNGEKVLLSEAIGRTHQIMVHRNDVHVLGYTFNPESEKKHKLMYWKNGIGTELPVLDIKPNAFALPVEMVIHDEDVYILGNEVIKTSPTEVYYSGLFWKNGILQSIQMPSPLYTNKPIQFNSILVESGKVQIIGNALSNGIWRTLKWENGLIVSASTQSLNKFPIRMIVDANTVHEIYRENISDFLYRENGAERWAIEYPSNLEDLAISGVDVFIAGKSGQTFETTVPTYWINGVMNKIQLNSNYRVGYAKSIFVKPLN